MLAPYSAFNFKVRLQLDGESRPLCEGAFSEVSGLEMSMDVAFENSISTCPVISVMQLRSTGAESIGLT